MAASSDFCEIHSSAVWAWAISPGPNTTLGMPPRDSTEASQKNSRPPVFFGRAARRNAWTKGRRESVSKRRAEGFIAGQRGAQFAAAQPGVHFRAHGGLGFAGKRATIHARDAKSGDDIGLGAALDAADVDGGPAEQRMPPLFQVPGIIGFKRSMTRDIS